MARGITELDVHQAADDLVSGGERPTVERIRAHLGTGSPNTVTRHLDTWWSSVGARLRQRAVDASRPGVPDAVVALAQRCWRSALEEAGDQARAEISADREALESARQDWQREAGLKETQLAQLQTAAAIAEQRAVAAEERCAVLKQRIEELTSDAGKARSERDGAYARQERLEQQLSQLREHAEAMTVQHAGERAELLVHARATEDRCLQEVDRARMAARQMRDETTAERETLRAELNKATDAQRDAGNQLAAALGELTIQSRLASSYADKLRQLGDLPERMQAALERSSKAAGGKARGGTRRRKSTSLSEPRGRSTT